MTQTVTKLIDLAHEMKYEELEEALVSYNAYQLARIIADIVQRYETELEAFSDEA
jgi:phosphopantothenate synthetase